MSDRTPRSSHPAQKAAGVTAKASSSTTPGAMIGAGVSRIEGPNKLSGRANYAADNHPPEMVYGYGVFSTIASGRITALNLDTARQMPGVIDIFHHDHFPQLYRSPSNFAQNNKVDETRLPFEDQRIYYAGQFVATVIAESYESARAAARCVAVSYSEEPAIAGLDQAIEENGTQPVTGDHTRGEADPAFESATFSVDAVYRTPVETHNPMEMHSSTAYWEGDDLTLYESSQGVVMAQGALAKIFNLPIESIRVHSPYIGSGFGGKAYIWQHAIIAAATSRELGHPVQLVVPRQQMFTTTGHRPATRQHLRLGANDAGKLVSIQHGTVSTTSFLNQYVERCGRMSKSLYSCPNVSILHETAQVNWGTPTTMRAPGATPGMFALESAIDELAIAAGRDPVEFRLNNYADRDESKDLPFSSNHIVEATKGAAERFGWADRNPQIGSMRDGREIVGYGMAATNWEALKAGGQARVSLHSDGTAHVYCATQDIGTGTYTVVAQAVSHATGIALERVTVHIGNSAFPQGPLSGGSMVTATTLPAVAAAARNAMDRMLDYATADGGAFAGAAKSDLRIKDGQVSNADGHSTSFSEILKRNHYASADGTATTQGADNKHSYLSFGAHFVEVRWDPGISRLRVARVVSSIDVGQIINQTTALNQVEGSIVMGLGMAMFEATEYDARSGRPVNNDLAEYMVPVHADQPDIDVILLDYPDLAFNEFGARGIGEIGTPGIAAAVANAVYHATGKRVRELPITLDKLMDDIPKRRETAM